MTGIAPAAPARTDDATLLHALTICVAPIFLRVASPAFVSSISSCGLLVPYGACAISPKYSISASGARTRRAERTERPPEPESKSPIIHWFDIHSQARREVLGE